MVSAVCLPEGEVCLRDETRHTILAALLAHASYKPTHCPGMLTTHCTAAAADAAGAAAHAARAARGWQAGRLGSEQDKRGCTQHIWWQQVLAPGYNNYKQPGPGSASLTPHLVLRHAVAGQQGQPGPPAAGRRRPPAR